MLVMYHQSDSAWTHFCCCLPGCLTMYVCICRVSPCSAVKGRCQATAPGCWAEREKQEDAVGHSGSGPGVCVSVPGIAHPHPYPHLHTYPSSGQLWGGSGRAMLWAMHVWGQRRRAACALWWAGLHKCQPGISHSCGASRHFIALVIYLINIQISPSLISCLLCGLWVFLTVKFM